MGTYTSRSNYISINGTLYIGHVSVNGKYTWCRLWDEELATDILCEFKVPKELRYIIKAYLTYRGEDSWYYSVGVVKCHPDDTFNYELGKKLAFDRAVKKLRERIVDAILKINWETSEWMSNEMAGRVVGTTTEKEGEGNDTQRTL